MNDYLEAVKKTHIALIHETWRESVARDLSTVAIFLGLWSFGYFIGSPALEWVGVLLSGIVLLGHALAL